MPETPALVRQQTTQIDPRPAVDISSARLPSRRVPITASGLRLLVRWMDGLILGLVSWYVLALSGTGLFSATVYQVLPYAAAGAAALWGLRTASAYEFGFSMSAIDQLLATANGAGIPMAMVGLMTYFAYPSDQATWPILAMILGWLMVSGVHAHVLVLYRHLNRQGLLNENVVIVGATPNARRLIERNAATRDLNIVGIFDDRLSRAPNALAGAPLLGRLDDLLSWNRLPEVDRIVVTVTSDARERVKTLVDRLRILPQRVVLLLDLDGFDPESQSLAQIAHSPAAYVSGGPRDSRRAASKRIFDLVFASLMLIGFSPLFLLLAIAIKLESPGPVFFRQNRHGFNNQIIRVWKFRSMRDDPEAAERMTAQTVEDDPRITRIGRLIRSTSIDEIPQLINVLKGEMSIVGPRPHAVGMTTEEQSVQSIVGDYAHRHRVKPGITGWAQINGSRGPVHTKNLVRERVRLDMEYVNRSSFLLDVYIMLMTAPRLLGDRARTR